MVKKEQKPLIIAILIVVLIIGGIFILVNLPTNYTGNVIDSVFKDCKNIQVPYKETEVYTDYLNAEVNYATNNDKVEIFGKGVYQEGIVSLKNVDNEAGWFTINFKWRTLNDVRIDKVRHFIEPDESVEFVSIFDTNLGEDNEFTYTYNSDPVQKTRIVTKYKTERVCN